MPDQFQENLQAQCDPLLDNIVRVKGEMHQMAVLLLTTSGTLAQGVQQNLLTKEQLLHGLRELTGNACSALVHASCLERGLPISNMPKIAKEVVADCTALQQQMKQAKNANSR